MRKEKIEMMSENGKKILFMASDNDMASGAFRSMTKLCELLQSEFGYFPIVVLPTDGDGEILLDEVSIEHIKIRAYNWVIPLDYQWTLINRIKYILKKILNRYAVHKVINVLKKEKIDIIHINTTYSYIGALAAKKIGIPCIWHLREILEDQSRQIWNVKDVGLINSVSKVVAISDYVYKKYQRVISSQKLVMVPNGIEEHDFYFERKKNDSIVIEFVCVGGLYEWKGQKYIIRACDKILKKGLTNFHVRFVGKGYMLEEYEHMVQELGLKNYISFCGAHKDVLPFYKQADVMIMSSKEEAFGRTTVEAMMAGCAVIGAESGATPEILNYGKCGYLFGNENYQDLADKMEYVLNNKDELFEMAQRGQKYALENFTAKLNAKRIAELYKTIE